MISGIQSPNKVRITLLGQVYTIEADASKEYIVKVAEYVGQKFEEISKNVPTANSLQVAILAALNIADELFQIKESEYVISDEIKEKAEMLISMLDEGLTGDIFSPTSHNGYYP